MFTLTFYFFRTINDLSITISDFIQDYAHSPTMYEIINT